MDTPNGSSPIQHSLRCLQNNFLCIYTLIVCVCVYFKVVFERINFPRVHTKESSFKKGVRFMQRWF